jgi:single-strand DNA-binding protein
MSYSVNRVTLLGRLGADPEVRSTSNGGRVATVSMATSRQWKDKTSGEKQEKTQWHRLVVWNRGQGSGLADVVEKYARKGDQLYIEGEIEYRQWEDKEGQTRYSTEINVQNLVLLGGKGNGERVTAAAPAGASANFNEMPEALDEDDDLPF